MAGFSFNVKIDGRDLIGTGSIIVHGKEEVVIQLSDIVFKISFESTEDKKLAVGGEQPGPKELLLKFKNFGNSLGSSYHDTVGIIDGRSLRGSFFVHAIGESEKETRVLNYTFSLGEVIAAEPAPAIRKTPNG